MKKMCAILMLACLSGSVSGQSFDYLPAPVQSIQNGQIVTHQILAYTQFTLSYNELHEQADWVAYSLTKAEAEVPGLRQTAFKRDATVLTGSAVDNDYRNSGFDRGHLSPAADNSVNDAINKESFLFSNMAPQLGDFNSDIWQDLEGWVREQAIEYDSVYVVTGPVFINSLGKIGRNEVTIPGAFYKIVMRFDGSTPRMLAFMIPHLTPSNADFRDYKFPVNALETITGIDFFPALSSRVENRVENQTSDRHWKMN